MNTKKIKYPSDNCDEACFYYCTKGGQQEPECVVIKNNGWIRIESESDLPKDNEDYYVVLDNEIYLLSNIISLRVINNCQGGNITHCQPIIKPSPPIY